jgi:hypothetical protein
LATVKLESMGYTFFGSDVETLTATMLEGLVAHLRSHGLVADRPLAVVVLDPDRPWPSTEVLFSLTFGTGDLARLVENGRRKAAAAKRTGLDSAQLAGPHRDRLRPGDFPFGGAVVRGDLVVGVSGFSSEQDHWIAETVAGFVSMKRQEALDQWRQSHPEARTLED